MIAVKNTVNPTNANNAAARNDKTRKADCLLSWTYILGLKQPVTVLIDVRENEKWF
jgi:hypothetical protein